MQVEFPEKLDFLFEPARYKIAYGGRGGAKSWGFGRALLILGAQKPLRILCAREFQNSIAESAHALLAQQVDLLGLSAYYDTQEKRILGSNGTEFIFKGLRHNRIVNNSMTEMRKRAADDVAPREIKGGSGDPGTVVAGAVGGPKGITAAYGKKGLKLAASAEGRARDIARNRQLAEAVTTREGELLERLLAAITARTEAERMAAQIGSAAGTTTNAVVRSQGERGRPYVPFGFPVLR